MPLSPDAVLRDALKTLAVRQVPDSEKLGVLPYKLGNLAGFRVVRTAAERDRDPDARPERCGRRRRAAVPADRDRSRRSAEAGGSRRVRAPAVQRRPGIKDIRIIRAESLRIGQVPGYEIVAEAKDAKSGIDVTTVQWLRFGGSGHLQMFAIARRTAWNDVFTAPAHDPRRHRTALSRAFTARLRRYCRSPAPRAGGAFGPPLATPTSAGRSTRSPIV